jgi:hypothetical protein
VNSKLRRPSTLPSVLRSTSSNTRAQPHRPPSRTASFRCDHVADSPVAGASTQCSPHRCYGCPACSAPRTAHRPADHSLRTLTANPEFPVVR